MISIYDRWIYYAPPKNSGEHIVAALSLRPSVSPYVPFVSGPSLCFLKLDFEAIYRNDHHIETTCRAQDLGRYLKGQGHSMTLQKNRVRPITLLFKSDFENISQKWSPFWDDVSRATFWSLPLRSRCNLAKSCPAQNFVIWSQILEIFYVIDHHIDTTCRAQHLGRYPEGQGHSMTFQRNCLRPITLLFEVEFYNYFTGMITILRQRVACNIWVATMKAKVTAWPCSKIVSGPKVCYLKSDFTTTFDKLLLCVQYLFGQHYPVPTGSCLKYM